MRVALVYDRVNKWGGAERVLLAFHKLFPDAPLYTSVCDLKKAPWAKVFDIRTSFLQKIPFMQSRHELLFPLMPLAFERFSFDEYDLVISITSESAKGIFTNANTKHICYCLTPTRYLWSGYEEYFKNKIGRFLSLPIVNALRKWDLIASKRPDKYIAISKEVQKRIKKYYDRESEIVYPPVILIKNQELRIKNQGKYFLVVSRLSKFTQYKRVDLAIKACNELKLPLKIVGNGSLRRKLEQMAGPSVEFLGEVDDKSLASYYRDCKALIFPGFEDLGLVMIEAQSAGKPVIAFEAGGAKEIVKDNKTGLFFKKQNVDDLVRVLRDFENFRYDPEDCRKNAERFGMDKFKKDFLSVVNNLI